MFGQKPGAVFAAGAPNGVFIARLDAIRPGDPTQTAQFLAAVQPRVSQDYLRDLIATTKAAAEKAVKVNANLPLARQALGDRRRRARQDRDQGRRRRPVTTEPDYACFQTGYRSGRRQLVWRRLIDDLETPVSAYLKIAHGRPYAFLFESVEGGAWRGRYSIVAMNPDLVWRCRGDRAEIAEGEAIDRRRLHAGRPAARWSSLRDLVAALAAGSSARPAADGRRRLFGVMGYDMVRLVERLPDVNPDPLGLPDAVLIRPSIVAIFDAIAQEIILVTTRAAERAGSGARRMPRPRPGSTP